MVKPAMCLLMLMLLAGCLASRVDGNRVNYANGMSFEISEAYTPVGRAPFVMPITAHGENRHAAATSVIHVFAKKDTQYKDTTEFIGVYEFHLPTRWFMKNPGMVSGRTFWLDLKGYPEVADLLKGRGMKSATRFLCEENFLHTFTDGQQSISYCIAESVALSGEEQRKFLTKRFSESVRLVSGSELPVAPQTSAPAQKVEIVSSQVAAAPSKGKYVVISYSKIGNATFSGRSYKSEGDALHIAVANCNYSDCRNTWVSNVDGCVAFARNGSGAWGKARGADKSEATAKALKLCNAHTKSDDCVIVSALCPDY